MPKKNIKDIAPLIESWAEEKNSAYLYRILAKKETKSKRDLFNKLAEEAEKQALMWQEQISKAKAKLPVYRPTIRTRLTGLLLNIFGPKQMHTILAAMKVRGLSVYLKSDPGHPWPKTLADIGRSHKSISSGNNLRAAIFGINDGLVSNLSLILGMAGAQSSNKIIILAGIAGLLAGAFSMGAGEYVSVRSQREMFEYQISLEKKELELYPAEETEELALIYHARGLSKKEADKIAGMLMKNSKHALDTLAREELGLNPDDLVSPYGAAIFSFLSFTVGAAVPLVPFLFLENQTGLYTAILLTGVCLFSVGAVLSLYTGRSALKSGLRMLFIGAIAGGITYLIGGLLGVSV